MPSRVETSRNYLERRPCSQINVRKAVRWHYEAILLPLTVSTADPPNFSLFHFTDNMIQVAQFESDLLPSVKQIEMRDNSIYDLGGPFPVTVRNLYLVSIFIIYTRATWNWNKYINGRKENFILSDVVFCIYECILV